MTHYLRYAQARDHLSALGLDLSVATLRRMVSERRVPFLKVPAGKAVLFDPADLAAWLASGRVAAGGMR